MHTYILHNVLGPGFGASGRSEFSGFSRGRPPFAAQFFLAVSATSLPGRPLCSPVRHTLLLSSVWPCLLLLCPAGHFAAQFVLVLLPSSPWPCLLLLCRQATLLLSDSYFAAEFALDVSATSLPGRPLCYPARLTLLPSSSW